MNIEDANVQALLRLSIFLPFFLVIVLWERQKPSRKLLLPKLLRWQDNLGIALINNIVLYFLFPLSMISFAFLIKENNWGILNYFNINPMLSFLIALILFDLVIYFQHVLVHKVPLLWRIHRTHHTDLDFDLTTAIRFHPFEIIFSMLIKLLTVLVIGAPPLAVLVFEIILNTMAMFNHGNLALPRKIDKYLRFFLVTPDMHRIHHSVLLKEANSNFGFNLSIWDRMFGSYKDAPQGSQTDIQIGSDGFAKKDEASTILCLLRIPFRKVNL